MMLSHHEEKLKEVVLENSNASRLGYRCTRVGPHIYLRRARWDPCICGHHPITDHCVIENRVNGNQLEVGNVCVTALCAS
jgi:hypothetical protein